MKANPDKFHLLLTDTDCQGMEVCNEKIENSFCEKLLGIKIDTKLKFEEHVETLCKKASQKINALTRKLSSMTFQQKKLRLNSFLILHFSYCPIFLRIIHQDCTTSFTDLLVKDNSLTIHHRNLQKLVTEMFKVKVGIALEIINDSFQNEHKPYNLRNKFLVKSNNVRSENYGTHTASFVGPRIWNTLPKVCQNTNSLLVFKENKKKWITENCPCRICKNYVKDLGFCNIVDSI